MKNFYSFCFQPKVIAISDEDEEQKTLKPKMKVQPNKKVPIVKQIRKKLKDTEHLVQPNSLETRLNDVEDEVINFRDFCNQSQKPTAVVNPNPKSDQNNSRKISSEMSDSEHINKDLSPPKKRKRKPQKLVTKPTTPPPLEVIVGVNSKMEDLSDLESPDLVSPQKIFTRHRKKKKVIPPPKQLAIDYYSDKSRPNCPVCDRKI